MNALQQIGDVQWAGRGAIFDEMARLWRDFDELRQCGVAHWLETKWVSFSSPTMQNQNSSGTCIGVLHAS